MDNVAPALDLRSLQNQHRFAPADDQSLRAICQRHSNPNKLEQRLLFFNAFLMDAGIIASKPAVNDRARRLGEKIRDNFDIALLCEIFEKNVLKKVLKAWDKENPPEVKDDAQDSTANSSGLAILSQQKNMGGTNFHEYENEMGSDAWAEKGIILTKAYIGLGNSLLELYVTHLNADGAPARRLQLLELAKFIEDNHDSNNVAIVAGDFNVNSLSLVRSRVIHMFGSLGGGGKDSDSEEEIDYGRFDNFIIDVINNRYPKGITEFEMLNELFTELGFTDMWTTRNGTPGYTSHMDVNGIANQICRPDAINNNLCDDINVPATLADFDSNFTNDDDNTANSGRLDYMFINQPNNNHTFSLDFTRPRRTRFERRADAPERDCLAFLSDHLGLTTRLIMAPR